MKVELAPEIHVVPDDAVPEGEAWLSYGSSGPVLARFIGIGKSGNGGVMKNTDAMPFLLLAEARLYGGP
jgi:hypothetical protein